MSVLLKGMNMPRDGERLKVWIEANGQVIVDKRTYYEEYEAVELPDHGDLIERDVVERLAVEIWMRNSNGDDAMQELIHKLREEVPAVIPAERSEASLCICDNCDQRNDKGCSVCKYIINERSEDGET